MTKETQGATQTLSLAWCPLRPAASAGSPVLVPVSSLWPEVLTQGVPEPEPSAWVQGQGCHVPVRKVLASQPHFRAHVFVMPLLGATGALASGPWLRVVLIPLRWPLCGVDGVHDSFNGQGDTGGGLLASPGPGTYRASKGTVGRSPHLATW